MKPTLVDPYGRPVASSWFYRAAGHQSRERTWIPLNTTDARKTADSFSRTQLLSHARYLYANGGFVKAVIDDVARFSVGDGISVQSHCEDPEAQKTYEEYWREVFAVRPETTEVHCMTDFLKNISSAIDVDGDLGLALTEHDDGEPCFQVFEGHEIGGVHSDSDRDSTIDGVRVDRRMKPIAYNVKTRDGTVKSIPRASFLHLFEPKRFTQTRGLTSLHHAIENLRDVLDILGYEKIAVKENSAVGMAIKGTEDTETDGGFFGSTSTETISSTDTITKEKLRGGAIPRLKPGEDLVSYESKRPGSTFTGFLDYLDMDVANGLGLPLAFVRAYKDGNGTAQRFILQKAQRKFNERTALLSRVLKTAWFYVIGTKINRGELPDSEGWWRITCQAPSKITVDVGREAQQNREDLKFGNRTLAEDLSDRGKDWEEHRKQKQREALDLVKRAKEIEMETGLPLKDCIALLQNQEGGQIALPASPPQPAQDENNDQ